MSLNTMRDLLVKNLYDNYSDEALIIRDWEMVPMQSVEIGIKFWGRTTQNYKMIGDIVGQNAVAPYFDMGKVFSETVSIRVIAVEEEFGANTSRNVVGDLVDQVERTILKEWPAILSQYNASLDRNSCFSIKDASFMVVGNQRFSAMQINFKLRELVKWDFVPDEEDRELLTENITIEVVEA